MGEGGERRLLRPPPQRPAPAQLQSPQASAYRTFLFTRRAKPWASLKRWIESKPVILICIRIFISLL